MAETTLTYEQARSNAERIADAVVKARVLRGLAVLREKLGPEFADMIDPDELLMDSPNQCALGQLYEHHVLTDEQRERLYFVGYCGGAPDVAVPGYFKALVIINGHVEHNPEEYGFDADSEDYDELTAAWLVVLGAEDGDV